MAKNAKKTSAVMIMIMIIVGFVQAKCNPQFASIESNNVPDKLGCLKKCQLLCGILFIIPKWLIKCLSPCVRRCIKKPTGTSYDCITDCGLTKSIDDNIGARGLATYTVDSCAQECNNK
ncbi:hypothetical protein CR513_18680, partial [Mucuna pruriens]